MSRIFLSHSSIDSRQAVALKQWLSQQRPELANEIFLDIDPQSGLRVGEQWKSQLFRSNSRCESIICLLSAHWLASSECKTEYRTAEGLGKRILVARLEDLGDTRYHLGMAALRSVRRRSPRPRSRYPAGRRCGSTPRRWISCAESDRGQRDRAADTSCGRPATDPGRAPYRGWDAVRGHRRRGVLRPGRRHRAGAG